VLLLWTYECAWPLLEWLRRRDGRDIERFLRLERAGQIEVTGMFAVLSQCLSHEGSWRQLYPVGRLRDDDALRCDINGQHWGLVDAVADAGIDAFAMAINENVGRAVNGSPAG
jgi:hypothetical protein